VPFGTAGVVLHCALHRGRCAGAPLRWELCAFIAALAVGAHRGVVILVARAPVAGSTVATGKVWRTSELSDKLCKFCTLCALGCAYFAAPLAASTSRCSHTGGPPEFVCCSRHRRSASCRCCATHRRSLPSWADECWHAPGLRAAVALSPQEPLAVGGARCPLVAHGLSIAVAASLLEERDSRQHWRVTARRARALSSLSQSTRIAVSPPWWARTARWQHPRMHHCTARCQHPPAAVTLAVPQSSSAAADAGAAHHAAAAPLVAAVAPKSLARVAGLSPSSPDRRPLRRCHFGSRRSPPLVALAGLMIRRLAPGLRAAVALPPLEPLAGRCGHTSSSPTCWSSLPQPPLARSPALMRSPPSLPERDLPSPLGSLQQPHVTVVVAAAGAARGRAQLATAALNPLELAVTAVLLEERTRRQHRHLAAAKSADALAAGSATEQCAAAGRALVAAAAVPSAAGWRAVHRRWRCTRMRRAHSFVMRRRCRSLWAGLAAAALVSPTAGACCCLLHARRRHRCCCRCRWSLINPP
jgi:hypothetical protein